MSIDLFAGNAVRDYAAALVGTGGAETRSDGVRKVIYRDPGGGGPP
ncbi:hypothetical protein FB558_3161 [Pseudonocardia kunmingensis]|uniref:Uncharacterized protein n=1 Tax=Pseudonocardia kunmingensis TaxID=630975 RepID=A0A543E416_9PSEU|nr:hypothetical protein FB558_3161 [Pseudonocardia kunmingensis]